MNNPIFQNVEQGALLEMRHMMEIMGVTPKEVAGIIGITVQEFNEWSDTESGGRFPLGHMLAFRAALASLKEQYQKDVGRRIARLIKDKAAIRSGQYL